PYTTLFRSGLAILHAHGAEFVTLANALPMRCGRRWTPPQIAHRRRSERNSFEDANIARGRSPGHQARIDAYRFLNGRGGNRTSGKGQKEKSFHDRKL